VNDDEVPKLPRGRGIKLAGPELFRIAVTAISLVAVIVLARPCGDAVGKFVGSFGSNGSAATAAMPHPGEIDDTRYKHVGSAMTADELKAIVEGSGAGSGKL
jgi:hypothetical protein